jgi:hypothetical protein
MVWKGLRVDGQSTLKEPEGNFFVPEGGTLGRRKEK